MTERNKKTKQSPADKTELWNIFETEVSSPVKNSPLECIFRECGDRESCDRCNASLAFSDEGFLTCINRKCGIIYKDLVDKYFRRCA